MCTGRIVSSVARIQRGHFGHTAPRAGKAQSGAWPTNPPKRIHYCAVQTAQRLTAVCCGGVSLSCEHTQRDSTRYCRVQWSVVFSALWNCETQPRRCGPLRALQRKAVLTTARLRPSTHRCTPPCKVQEGGPSRMLRGCAPTGHAAQYSQLSSRMSLAPAVAGAAAAAAAAAAAGASGAAIAERLVSATQESVRTSIAAHLEPLAVIDASSSAGM